ncbi:response regulator [Chloroflexota bacterium]
MSSEIHVAILDDHQSIIDGYTFRLSQIPDIRVVASANFGDELEPMLKEQPIDILLLDVGVPTSPESPNPYPILHLIPELLQTYPDLNILVISMHNQPALINSVMNAGASGYILKDDRDTLQELGSIIRTIARGDIHLSKQANQQLKKKLSKENSLTPRQIEALSLSAAYPDETSAELGERLGIENSTVRNLLTGAYFRLNVRNRTAAVIKARQLGLIAPHLPTVDINESE